MRRAAGVLSAQVCVQVSRYQAKDSRYFSMSHTLDSCCLRSSVAGPLMP